MKLRLKIVVAAVALGTAGLLAVGAYAESAAHQATLSPEASALNAMGFSTTELAATSTPASPGASAATGKAKGHPLRRLRVFMRKNTLHGQIVVQTKKNGPVTVDVQRGTVTAVTGNQVTVKSTDGVTWTWTEGSKIAVVQNRKHADWSAVKVGENVGVAGATVNGTLTARLVIIVAS